MALHLAPLRTSATFTVLLFPLRPSATSGTTYPLDGPLFSLQPHVLSSAPFVSSTALFHCMGTLSFLTLCPLYDPLTPSYRLLSPLRPSVPSTALCPFVPSTALCPFYGVYPLKQEKQPACFAKCCVNSSKALDSPGLFCTSDNCDYRNNHDNHIQPEAIIIFR
jgi:hypothetical protein